MRPLQIVFSICTFAVMASAGYASQSSSSNNFCTGSSICQGRSFYNYSSYTFLVAVTVMSFVYSLLMLLLNLGKVGRRSGTQARTCMPTTAMICDTFFIFMIFGASCASAALTTGLNELQPGFCNYLSSNFCGRVTAAPVLGFLTWFLFFPSYFFNMLTVNSEGPVRMEQGKEGSEAAAAARLGILLLGSWNFNSLFAPFFPSSPWFVLQW